MAIDGFSHATKALKTAVEMTQRCDAELTIFYALRVDYKAIVSRSARDAYKVIGEQQCDQILDDVEKIAADMGVGKVSRLSLEREPARVILQAAVNVIG